MIVFTTNILVGPMILLIWLLDTCLFLLFIRIILSKINTPQLTTLAESLKQITEPLHRLVDCHLPEKYQKEHPWTSWVIIVGGLFVIRYLIITIVVLMNQSPPS